MKRCVMGTVVLFVGVFAPFTAQAYEYGGVVEYVPGQNDYMMLFTRETGSSLSIRGQRCDAWGEIEPGSEFTVADVDGAQFAPRLVRDSVNGTYLALWTDRRDNNSSAADIRSRLLNPDGTAAGDVNLVCDDLPFTMTLPLDVVFNAASQEFLVVWEETVNYVPAIFGQRMSSTGAPVGDVIAISPANYTAKRPAVAADASRDRYLVVWESPSDRDISGRFIGGDGTPDGDAFAICDGVLPDDPGDPLVEFGSASDSYLVVWHDSGSSSDSSEDVFGQLVGGDGTLVGGRVPIQDGDGDQVPTDIIGDGPFSVMTTQAEAVNNTNSVWIWGFDNVVTDSQTVWTGTADLRAGRVTGALNDACGNMLVLWELDDISGGFPMPGGHETDVLGTPCELFPPDIQVTPQGELDCGSALVGQDAQCSLTITNAGGDILAMSGINLGGADASQFALTDSGHCSEADLEESEDCVLHITFTPDSAGQKTATLSIMSNDPDEPTVTVSLLGTGLDHAPKIQVEPMTVEFFIDGQQPSDFQEVVITNIGDAPLELGGFIIENVENVTQDGMKLEFFHTVVDPETGYGPCEFNTVEAGESCTVDVTFTLPAGYSAEPGEIVHGTLHIMSNDPQNPDVSVELTGTFDEKAPRGKGCSSVSQPNGSLGLLWGLLILLSFLGLRFRANMRRRV